MNTFILWLNWINHLSGAAAAAAVADTDNCKAPVGCVLYGSLTHRGVIVDPSKTPPSCHREALPTDDRQTGSVWLGYTEQTLAATWWLDTAYICSLHQHHWGPRALGVWLSFLAPSPTIFFFLNFFCPLQTPTKRPGCVVVVRRWKRKKKKTAQNVHLVASQK